MALVIMLPKETRSRWKLLDQLLLKYQKLWQFRPFDYDDYPWRADYPRLSAWADQQTLDSITALDRQPEQLMSAVSPFLPALKLIEDLIHLQKHPQYSFSTPKPLLYKIPDRKLRQIEAFAAAAQLDQSSQLAEWCAGKGHLGRLVAANGHSSVESLEINQQLCKSGEKLAGRARVKMRFHQIDVMDDTVIKFLTPGTHAFALHACGHLHRQLLQKAVKQCVQKISLAPCCYHIGVGENYYPISSNGDSLRVKLSQFDMKLALQETVTANARTIKLRNLEMNWRLGFDALQRELSGTKSYATLPSIKESQLSKDFASFCDWAAEQIELKLPAKINYDKFLLPGEKRRVVIARMEIIRHLFRRPLELWLVYDLVSFLEENGYSVRLGEFCPKKMTPRNILICGKRIAWAK